MPCWPLRGKAQGQGYQQVNAEEDDGGGLLHDEARSFDGCPNERKIWPEFTSGFFSRLVFAWYDPLVLLGSRTSLELSDIWKLAPSDEAGVNSDTFWALWESELARAKRKGAQKGKDITPWLGFPIIKFTWKPLIKAAIMRLSADLLQFGQPLLMQQILLIVEGSPAWVSEEHAYVLAIAMAVCSYTGFLIGTHYDNIVNRVSFRLRSAIVGALYRKSIGLSTGAKASYSSGKIVNMMSNDAMKAQMLVRQINYAWSVPMNFTLALYLLVDLVGPPAYAGLILVGVVMPPLMTFWMKSMRGLRKTQMKVTDQRSKEMTEILTSIRIIKFMSWEQRFVDKVTVTRDEELQLYRSQQLMSTLLSSIFQTLPILMVVLVIGLYGYMGSPITASMAFTTISLMDMVRRPLMMISWILNSVLVDGKTSVDRLSRFMVVEDLSEYVERAPYRPDRPAVELRGLTIKHPTPEEPVFDPEEERTTITAVCCALCCPKTVQACWKYCRKCCPALPCRKKKKKMQQPEGGGSGGRGGRGGGGGGRGGRGGGGRGGGGGGGGRGGGGHGEGGGGPVAAAADIDRGPCVIDAELVVQPGTLCCIVGKVGSGKSSLLLSLMGEIDKVDGSVKVAGTVSYAAQAAMVNNATVKENILYGNLYDEARYNTVVAACALLEDIENLPAGDQTQIGEKGISLSGGQKQRVGLARAVYHEADVYLLDDPLSAVDAHVGRHIFEECIAGLLKDKTVLLPVHNLNFLERADYIVALEDKRIAEQGTYAQLMHNGEGRFCQMMEEFAAAQDDDGDDEDEGAQAGGAAEATADAPTAAAAGGKKPAAAASPTTTPSSSKHTGKMMETEERVRGGVDKAVYTYYLRQSSLCAVILIAGSFMVQQSTSVGQNWWMTRWTVSDLGVVLGYDESWSSRELLTYFLVIYCVSAFVANTCSNLRRLMITLVGLRTSRKLHNRLLSHILKAPIKFYDVTPVGRIVNRFTSDIASVDQSVIYQWSALSDYLLTTLVAMTITSLATPAVFVVALPVAYLFWGVQEKYRYSARELKRLSSIARSPIFAHFNETLSSLTTARAFEAQPRLVAKNNTNNDSFGRTMLSQQLCFRWLAIRLNAMSTTLTAIVTTWITLNPHQLDPGLTAMVITYSLQVTSYLQWLINAFTSLEIEMNSIERVKHYSEIPIEAPYTAHDDDNGGGGSSSVVVSAPEVWPEHGRIEFINACARYRPELPLVLRDVSFVVNAREKVAVVGRTGSGKSTLMQLLFRIMELSSGRIEIDGVDISRLGLKQLRSAISILPQDPTLFAGTIRENIDPFEQYTDAQLWGALGRAQMKESVSALPEMLETAVGDGGEAFSVGERQLLCLARSILAESKLLIMDECTASVDVRTDAKIQEMVREAFANCTVFAIAHRLDTIIDYDRIAVLDNGVLAEYGTPSELVDKTGGLLAALVEQAGPSQAPRLRAIARGERALTPRHGVAEDE